MGQEEYDTLKLIKNLPSELKELEKFANAKKEEMSRSSAQFRYDPQRLKNYRESCEQEIKSKAKPIMAKLEQLRNILPKFESIENTRELVIQELINKIKGDLGKIIDETTKITELHKEAEQYIQQLRQGFIRTSGINNFLTSVEAGNIGEIYTPLARLLFIIENFTQKEVNFEKDRERIILELRQMVEKVRQQENR